MSDTDATQARQDVVADVDEILEHVINGNMLSMPYDVYVELFDAVDGLGAEIENLQSQNARLREEIEAAKHDLSLFSGELVASKLENAKLRELVKALLTCATDGDCDECRLNGATPWHVGKAQLCDGVWDCVRELGVEVDG